MSDNEIAEEHSRWMGHALELAERARQAGEVPVGAVVVRDGEIVGEGYNCPISTHDPTGHAEITALRDAARRLDNYRLSGCRLYVTIEPCTMCAGAMIHARVGTLVFGAREPRAGAIRSHLHLSDQTIYNHRITVVEGVRAAECGELLTHFFRARRGGATA